MEGAVNLPFEKSHHPNSVSTSTRDGDAGIAQTYKKRGISGKTRPLVLHPNREGQKGSRSLQQTIAPDPIENIEDQYHVGQPKVRRL